MNQHTTGSHGRANGRPIKKILVVDDHPLIRQGMLLLLSHEPDFEVCGEAQSVDDAITAFRETRPDVVITDLTLSEGNGLELVKHLMAMEPSARILVVSMHDETLYAERALRAGALGYVEKGETTERLIAAVRRILGGHVYLSEQMTDRMLCRTIGNQEEWQHSPIQSLSDRELEVFEQIGHGITTRKIANLLHLSPKTIETYRENIKAKLGLENAAQLTQHAVKWVLESTGTSHPVER